MSGERPSARGRWEQVFRAVREEVGEARRWARRLLPAHCDVAADTELVLGELLANAAVHSPVAAVLVVLAHDRDGLRGEVHELGETGGAVTLDSAALAEMRQLRAVPEHVRVSVDDLRESGRGLAIVAHLCGRGWGVTAAPYGRTAWFVLPGCRCQLRTRHPAWGIVPGDDLNPWRAVRKNYPSLVARDPLKLMDGMAEAEHLGPLTRRDP
ncbi:hypothetical protein DPM19_21330 [Actinomadura craniellae]|uniref:ATP-binding protein n=1 Tax=Actinomadura craniellae TaxID=2231787 RepID=A0A365H1Y5_9ACTN|nr:ATP-binding protein [Actinomadura craniellae]RAY13049.1 hypothetical protein DPM19_21330 [Actinomadura craniellae]